MEEKPGFLSKRKSRKFLSFLILSGHAFLIFSAIFSPYHAIISDGKHGDASLDAPDASFDESNQEPRKIRILTHQAYGKLCSKCRMLFNKEEIDSPMFAYRIFCGAEYCIKQR